MGYVRLILGLHELGNIKTSRPNTNSQVNIACCILCLYTNYVRVNVAGTTAQRVNLITDYSKINPFHTSNSYTYKVCP